MSLPRAVGLTVYDLYQIEHANDVHIAYLALEGSHIYNTNIDHVSDTDFLAVIEPDARDILLQRADVNISAHSDYNHHDVRIWTPYTVMSSLQKSAMDIISILKADNVYLTHGPIGEFMKRITEHADDFVSLKTAIRAHESAKHALDKVERHVTGNSYRTAKQLAFAMRQSHIATQIIDTGTYQIPIDIDTADAIKSLRRMACDVEITDFEFMNMVDAVAMRVRQQINMNEDRIRHGTICTNLPKSVDSRIIDAWNQQLASALSDVVENAHIRHIE